jgi:hypothetical protein
VLEDYACLADGLLALSGVTGEPRWAALAGDLLDTALARFSDGNGGFFDTADDGEALLYRPADPADGPTPSGAFALAGALVGYAALTGAQRYREAAIGALAVLEPIAGRFPRAAGAGLAVAEALVSGPAEIAVVGPAADPRTVALHRTALLAAPPGAVLALGDGGNGTGGYGPDADRAGGDRTGGAAEGDGAGRDGAAAAIPLLAGRGLVAGAPAAYVCRNFTCRTPVTDPMDLRGVLAYPGDEPPG